jgi:hypothetical protein
MAGGSSRPRPVALDHNFPEPIVRTIEPYLPEVRSHWIRHVDGRLSDMEDHDLVYELHRVGFSVMVTGNYKMRIDPRVLVAVEQTRMSLLTIQGAGDDPVLATGVLLRDLLPILRGDVHKGLLYKIRPTRVRGDRARDLVASLPGAPRVDDLVRQYGRTAADRQRYPEGDPRRFV